MAVNKSTVILLLVVILTSCINRNKELSGLIKTKESQLVIALGKPKKVDTIFFNDEIRLLEYQSNLYNLIDLKTSNSKVLVKEMRWEKADQIIVFWLMNNEDQIWESFDFLEWNPKEISY